MTRFSRALLAGLLSGVPLASLHGQRPGANDSLTMPVSTPLRFTTDEVTWMSVDVSPDGRTVVFDLLGDLYTLPMGGGTARRITSGQGFDAMPRFSPDGRRVVFVSDRSGASNVWTVDADGSQPRAITRTDRFHYVSPGFTKDGRAILVSRNNTFRSAGPFDLYVIHVAGGNAQRLTGLAPPAAPAGGPGGGAQAQNTHFGARFAPDGRTIWYSTSGATAQLFTFDLPTGQVIRQTNQRAGAFRPIPSPDGKWVVYGTRRNDATALRLRDLTSGDERWFVLDAQRDGMSGSPTRDLLPGVAWTPDGSALIASRGGKLWRFAVPSGAATPIPFTAEVDQMIGATSQFQYAHADSVLEVRQIRVPKLSPDGKKVAFIALERLWTADLPSAGAGATATITNARALTNAQHSAFAPAWSPDGRYLAYATWHDSLGGDIHRVEVSSGRIDNLTRRLGYYDKLAYTPDGSSLLFAHTTRAARFEHDELGFQGPSQTDADLYRMPANGGQWTSIMRLELFAALARVPFYGVPHFGPDTGRVVIFDTRNRGLFSFRMDGSDRTLLLRANQTPWNSGADEPAEDIVLSPQGGRAAILGMQNLYLASFLPVGAPATMTVSGNIANASVPLRRVTKVGATFAGWSTDGRILHYAIGPSLFLYDVARADSIAVAGGTYEPLRVDVRISVPKDRPDGVVALRGARVITMRGTEVIASGDVVVRNNRIVGVGQRGRVEIPRGARIIDVSGKTIIPGLVDTHAHIIAPGWGLHRTDPWQLYANLAYGVTAMRDPQTSTTDAIDYGDAVEAGNLIGPRLYSTGRGFFDQEEINSLEDARNTLRRNSDFLKTETIKQYLVGDRRRRQWIVQAARELRLSPTNEGGADVMLNITHMLDGYAGEEHSLPTWPLYKDVVQLAVASNTTYTPALIVAYGGPAHQEYFTSRFDMRAEPRLQRFWPLSFMESRTMQSQWRPDEFYAFPHLAADVARIAAAGGKIGVGSHGNLQGIGYHMEMWALQMGGMKPHDVLRSATIVGAEAIGHKADFGSLEPGKLADLLILDRNPLENIRHTNSVRQVMKNGRLYDALTLDEAWPRRRKMPVNQWWMAPERR